MKTLGWMLALVAALSIGAWAQCGCASPEAPDCYLVFKTNQTIAFRLEAPIDYFVMHQTSLSPALWGWRVESWDGTVVRAFVFPDGPVGRWQTLVWDLYGDDGFIVSPGYYRLIAMTTDGDVSYPVRIVEACRPACGCYVPPTCDLPCCIPYGELYLSLSVGDVRPCAGLSIRLTLTFECSEEL